MRVIAGRLGGRIFNSPGTVKTHPMSDKMRGALFNILSDISADTVLDAFAGSGALAFEAISRGAQLAVAIERDRQAQIAITQNITALDIASQMQLIKASANAWLTTTFEQFTLVLLDPPYNDLQPALLAALAERCQPNGRLVMSWPGKQAELSLKGLTLHERKDYGDASLCFYERF